MADAPASLAKAVVYFVRLRSGAERPLGNWFDLRRFHDAVPMSGSLPLAVLEQHVNWWTPRKPHEPLTLSS